LYHFLSDLWQVRLLLFIRALPPLLFFLFLLDLLEFFLFLCQFGWTSWLLRRTLLALLTIRAAFQVASPLDFLLLDNRAWLYLLEG
jgi:hypothetical protein